MPLTDRVKIIAGNILQVTNCDGTKEEYTIDCDCAPEIDNPGTTPPPVGTDLCATANWWAHAMRYVLYIVQDNLNGQPNTFLGRHAAIATAAYNLQLPVSPWVWFMNGFVGADNPTAAANLLNLKDPTPDNQTNHDILVCIIDDILDQNGGIVTYEMLKTRMEAQGWYAWGEMVSAIPMGTFLAQIYNLSLELPPLGLLAGVDNYDCELCEDVPVPVDCPEECTAEVCNRLIPLPAAENAFLVTGFASIADFAPPNDACWFGADFNPLRIDMLTNKCVKRVILHSYTPCSAGGGVRSAHYRIEIDDVNVSEFKCSALGTAAYTSCGGSAFDGDNAIFFEFDTPLFGRRINIVPLREQVTLVQVDIVTCE